MKKLIILFSTFLLFFVNVYADNDSDEDRYSEWSKEETGYPLEESKILYGYQYPIEWSEWEDIDIGDPYTKSEYRPFPTEIPKDKSEWKSRSKQTLYTWPETGEYVEPKKLLEWAIDIDAFYTGDYSIKYYYEPKMELVCKLPSDENVVVGTTPGRGGTKENMSINMYGKGEYLCKKVTLNMIESIPDSGKYHYINRIGTVSSSISFETLCFSHVIKWSEGTGWRETEPYIDTYGSDPIKAVEETYYRHPLYYYIDYELYGGSFTGEYPKKYYPEDTTYLVSPNKRGYEFIGFHIDDDFKDEVISKIVSGTRGDIKLYAEYKRVAPTIDVEQRYIYEDDTIDSIKDLATAYDELDGDITDKIIVQSITYDDTGTTYYYPSTFDPYTSDTIHATYEVTNSSGIKEEKTVKLYILKDGVFVDLKIYDRYISKEFLNTLESNSIWNDSNYKKTLKDAIERLERK